MLHLESVFYVVALLNLPKLWLALFFVKAIKSSSEMYVATKRIFGFVQELEARAPAEEDAHGVHTCCSIAPGLAFAVVVPLLHYLTVFAFTVMPHVDMHILCSCCFASMNSLHCSIGWTCRHSRGHRGVLWRRLCLGFSGVGRPAW